MATITVQVSDEERKYIKDTLSPALRKSALLDLADRLSGKRWQELTAGLSEKNAQSLLLCPMFINGDSSDIDTFVCDFWRRPVTDENYLAVAQAFKEWYKEHAPDEYHDPRPTPTIAQGWTIGGWGNG